MLISRISLTPVLGDFVSQEIIATAQLFGSVDAVFDPASSRTNCEAINLAIELCFEFSMFLILSGSPEHGVWIKAINESLYYEWVPNIRRVWPRLPAIPPVQPQRFCKRVQSGTSLSGQSPLPSQDADTTRSGRKWTPVLSLQGSIRRSVSPGRISPAGGSSPHPTGTNGKSKTKNGFI
jgi:hypothetical protein